MHPSILYKLLVLTLSINRSVGQPGPHAIDHIPRIHAAVFALPFIGAGVTTILQAIASTTAALLAAKMACDWYEIERLKEELRELEEELEQAKSEADAVSEEEDESDESADDEVASQSNNSSEESVEDENIAEQDEPKTVEDVLDGTTPGRETKGKVRQYVKEGGDEQANEDFDSLQPENVYSIGYGRVGTLPDGSKVIVRTESGDGRTTLEIQHASSSRVTKIRYNN